MKFQFIILSFIIFPSFLISQTGENIDSKIKRMIKIETPERLFDRFAKKLMWEIKVGYPDLLKGKNEEIFTEELKAELFIMYIEVYTPIYKDIYTEKEIDAYLNFYSGEIGKSIQKKKRLITEQLQSDNSKLSDKISDIVASGFKILDSLEFTTDNCCCENALEGKFVVIKSNGDSLSIERTKDKQIVKTNKDIKEYRIIWLSNCKYKLSLLKKDNPDVKTNWENGIYNIYWSKTDSTFYEIKKSNENNYLKLKYIKKE